MIRNHLEQGHSSMAMPSDLRFARHGRSGFSLVEAVVASLLVGLMVVASLQALAASLSTQTKSQDLLRATLLAEQLMTELTRLPWSDPQAPATAGTIGKDTGDPSSPISRSELDDLDDFDDWTETPPADHDGVPLSGMSNWTRTVTIQNISVSDGTAVVSDNNDQGLRRVTVSVTRGPETLAEVAALFSRDAPSLQTDPWERTPSPQ